MQHAEHCVWYATSSIKRGKVKNMYSWFAYICIGNSRKIHQKWINLIPYILGKGWELGGWGTGEDVKT